MLNFLSIILILCIISLFFLFEYKIFLQCELLRKKLPKKKKVKKVVVDDDLND